MHSWVEHTGELELSLEAGSREGLFGEALAAFGELLAEREGNDGEGRGDTVERELAISAPDPATLLAEWLSELLFLAESEGLVPVRAERIDLGEETLEAMIVARLGSPPHLVKAVTYHRLGMWAEHDIWRGRVILDV